MSCLNVPVAELYLCSIVSVYLYCLCPHFLHLDNANRVHKMSDIGENSRHTTAPSPQVRYFHSSVQEQAFQHHSRQKLPYGRTDEYPERRLNSSVPGTPAIPDSSQAATGLSSRPSSDSQSSGCPGTCCPDTSKFQTVAAARTTRYLHRLHRRPPRLP